MDSFSGETQEMLKRFSAFFLEVIENSQLSLDLKTRGDYFGALHTDKNLLKRSIAKLDRPDQVQAPSERYTRLLQHELALDEAFLSEKHDGNRLLDPMPPSPLDAQVIAELQAIVGRDYVQVDDYNRVKYSHGKLQEELFNLKRCVVHEICGAVVHPRDKQDVQKIVAYCNTRGIPMYVVGGGSSCNKGFLPQLGGIALALSTHMNRVLEVNELNQTVRVQAGCMGPELARVLNNAHQIHHTRHRYTCGHFPQSFELRPCQILIPVLFIPLPFLLPV